MNQINSLLLRLTAIHRKNKERGAIGLQHRAEEEAVILRELVALKPALFRYRLMLAESQASGAISLRQELEGL